MAVEDDVEAEEEEVYSKQKTWMNEEEEGMNE
jgi:hypothetical protein